MQFSYYILKKPDRVINLLSEAQRQKAANLELHHWHPPYTVDQPEGLVSQPRYFVTQAYDNSPPWLRYFNLSPDADLKNAGAAGAIFAEFSNHWIAICFGYSNRLLNPELVIHDFGMRTAMATVNEQKISQLTTLRPDQNTIEKTQKLAVAANRFALDIDENRELPTSMHGYAEINEAKLWLDGQKGLKVRGEITDNEILTFGSKLLTNYLTKDLPSSFKWAENISQVQEKIVIEALNHELAIEVSEKAVEGLDYNINFIPFSDIEYLNVYTYKFVGISNEKMKRYPTYSASDSHDSSKISIENYIKTLSIFNRSYSPEDLLENHKVCIEFEDGPPMRRSVKSMLHFVTKLNRITYLLIFGKWYKFSNDFIRLIERTLNDLPTIQVTPIAPCQNEARLNKNLKTFASSIIGSPDEIMVLDSKKISMKESGYPRSNLECCDFIDRNANFVHIKSAKSSSKLSHLWTQAQASASLWNTSLEYRKAVHQKIFSETPNLARALFHSEDFLLKERPTVVFSILSRRFKATQDLFLLSKLALFTAVKNIEQNGFNVKFEYLMRP